MEQRSEKSGAPLLALSLVGFFAFVVVLTVGFLVAKTWLPPVASQHGEGIDFVINYLLITTGAIFILGHVILGYFVWRYSRNESPGYRRLSGKSEWIWALIPVLVFTVISEVGVLFLGLPVWGEIYTEDEAGAIEVEVVGKQFEWLVRYPGKDGKFGNVRPELVHDTRNPVGLDEEDPAATDDIVLRKQLYLPEGRKAVIRLRSQDVLHSFAVPQLRVKQDVVPGFVAATRFKPIRVGEYDIACAELCGLGHYRMNGLLYVKPEGEFETWLSQQQGWFE